MRDSSLKQNKSLIIFSLVFFVIGLLLVLGGTKLIAIGGSPYYLLSGLGLFFISWAGWNKKTFLLDSFP